MRSPTNVFCMCMFLLIETIASKDPVCNTKRDVVFILDGSESIIEPDFIRLKNFVSNMISQFEIGSDAVHVGMLSYSTRIGDTIGLFPPKSKVILQAVAKNLKHQRTGTNTDRAIRKANEMIRQQGRSRASAIIVLITDGRSTNPKATIMQATLAKARKIKMVTIGVGKEVYPEELRQIASGPSYVKLLEDYRSLANIADLVKDIVCKAEKATNTSPTSPISTSPPKPTSSTNQVTSTKQMMSPPQSTNQVTSTKQMMSPPQSTNQVTSTKQMMSPPQSTNQVTSTKQTLSTPQSTNQVTSTKQKLSIQSADNVESTSQQQMTLSTFTVTPTPTKT